jgi:hypothetical protein
MPCRPRFACILKVGGTSRIPHSFRERLFILLHHRVASPNQSLFWLLSARFEVSPERLPPEDVAWDAVRHLLPCVVEHILDEERQGAAGCPRLFDQLPHPQDRAA